MPTLRQQPAPAYSQGLTDPEYRKRYGTGQAATEARIRAVLTHRGRTPSAGRISDIYRRRAQEFNTTGYGALREWAGPSKAKPTKGGAKKPTVDTARGDALRDAIAAINAQFGFNRAELGQQRTDLANYFRQNKADLLNQQQDAERASLEDAIARGIGRSSVYAQNRGDVIKEGADARARLMQEFGGEGSRAMRIQSAMKLLGQQREKAVTEARTTSAKGELDLETLLALIGVGMQGTNFAGV